MRQKPGYAIFIIKNSRLILGLLLSFTFLLAYLRTMAPTVTFQDSGDFISSAYVLGIPHPPGYPLYMLLGKLFTFFPGGNIAQRVTLISVLFAALSGLIIYLLMSELTGRTVPSLATALIFAFSRTFWSQSVIVETYSLNIFFTSLLILLLLKWEKAEPPGKPTYLLLFFFVYGLSLTNHLSVVLLIIPFLLFFLDSNPFPMHRRTYVFICLCILIPMTLYLYLPLRASAHPLKDWGDPHTLVRFLKHVTVSQYQSFLQVFPAALYPLRLLRFFSALKEEFSVWLVWLAIPGLIAIYRKSQKHFLFFLLIFLTNLLFFTRNQVSDQVIREHNYIPTYFVVAIWIGWGINALWSLATSYGLNRTVPFKSAVSCLLLGVALIPFISNYSFADKSTYYYAYDYGSSLLNLLKPKAILIATDDNNGMPLEYLQYVEKKRLDVTVVIEPLLRLGWYREELRRRGLEIGNQQTDEDHFAAEIVSRYIERRPIYLTKLNDYLAPVYRLDYEGLAFRVQKPSATINARISLKPFQPSSRNRKNMYKDADMQWAFAQPYLNLGRWLAYQEQFQQAETVLREAVRLHPLSIKLPYSLAILYLKEKKPDSAIPLLQKLLKMDNSFDLAYERLSYAYMLKNNFAGAVEMTRKALMFFPESQELRARLGAIYFRGGWDKEAESELKNTLALGIDYPDAHYFLAQLYDSQGRKTEAIREWRFLVQSPERRYSRMAEDRLRTLELNR